MSRLVACTSVFTFALLGAACDGTTEPKDATPAAIVAAVAQPLIGVVGEELPQPVIVKVTNAAGEPLAGVLVDFRITAGGGTIRLGAALTDEQGLARDYWTLGRTAGATQTLEARVVDAGGARPALAVSVQATTRPGPPALISTTTFLPSAGIVGATLPTPISVLVKDRYHNPLQGVTVRLTPTPGSGTANPSAPVTNSSGIASASWTLGPDVGVHAVTVSVEGAVTTPSQFTLSVNAMTFAGVILWDNVFRRLDNNTGTRRAELVVGDTLHFNAIVRNAAGQAVSGASVTWESTTATGPVARVEANGFVQALAPGTVKITARSGTTVSDTVALRVLPPVRPASVTAQSNTVCVTFAGGGFTCVDPSFSYITGPTPGTSAFRTIASGHHGTLGESCGLDGAGNVLCRKGDGSVTALGGGVTFSALSSNGSSYCGLTADGRAYCWGTNQNGRLGTGSAESSATPVAVAGDRRYISISTGDLHSCAVATDGTAWCWGTNEGFALGQAALPSGFVCMAPTGTTSCSLVPVQVSGSTRFRTVSVGGYGGSCGLSTESTIECWGRGAQGATGNGIASDRFTPAPIASPSNFTALSSNTFYSCAIRTDGIVECWGGNFEGRTGRGTSSGVSSPLPILLDRRFTSIAAGGPATCGITEGELWCWGVGTPLPWSPLDRLGPMRIGLFPP